MRDEKLAQIAIKIAKRWLGVPYKLGGESWKWTDCSQLMIEALQSVGKFPRYADERARDLWKRYPIIPKPLPGCLVFYYNPARTKIIHVEMYIGDGLTIGAVKPCVMIRPLGSLRNRLIAGYNDPFQLPLPPFKDVINA